MALEKQSRGAFWATVLPPTLWIMLFFLVPLAIVWGYSFGKNDGLTGVAITGTFDNYVRAFNPTILQIFLKSIIVAGITTLL